MRLWSSCAIGVVTALWMCAGSAFGSYVPCLPGSGGDLKSDAKSPLIITIDVSRPRQKIRSFGASDAWSTQYVGRWPDEKRDAIADLLFQTGLDERKNPRGIGLSAWRFNLGAGSTRQTNFTDDSLRPDHRGGLRLAMVAGRLSLRLQGRPGVCAAGHGQRPGHPSAP